MTHTEIELDPEEQNAARYRLFSRAIKIIGLSQIAHLTPLLQEQMESILGNHLQSKKRNGGILHFSPLSMPHKTYDS